MTRKQLKRSIRGLSSCSFNCGTVYWQVDGTWGAVK